PGGAAGAGVDRHERIAGVILPREDRVVLEPVERLPKGRDAGLDLRGHLAVQRQELLRVLVLLRDAAVALEALRQARVLGRDLRRVLLVVPEAGLAELFLQLGDTALESVRVEGNHGPRRAGPRSPGAAGRAALR